MRVLVRIDSRSVQRRETRPSMEFSAIRYTSSRRLNLAVRSRIFTIRRVVHVVNAIRRVAARRRLVTSRYGIAVAINKANGGVRLATTCLRGSQHPQPLDVDNLSAILSLGQLGCAFLSNPTANRWLTEISCHYQVDYDVSSMAALANRSRPYRRAGKSCSNLRFHAFDGRNAITCEIGVTNAILVLFLSHLPLFDDYERTPFEIELQSDGNIINLEQWWPTSKCNEHRATPCELCERDRGRTEEAGISRRLASRHVVWTRPKVWLAYSKENFYGPFASSLITNFLVYFLRTLPCEM